MTKAALRREIGAVAIALALLVGAGFPVCAAASPVLGQQMLDTRATSISFRRGARSSSPTARRLEKLSTSRI
jgi:hypothetical protein